LLRYCSRPPFALERLSVIRGPDGRISGIRYALPGHEAAARVGEEFPLECPACGGDIRLMAFITEPGPIRKILTHLGEPLEPPPVSPARGPPTDWGDLVQVHDDRDILSGVARRTARDRHPLAVRPTPDARSPQGREAAGLGETPRRRQKEATLEGEGMRAGKGLMRAGRQSTRLTSRSSAR
jgi:hypothetical protein